MENGDIYKINTKNPLGFNSKEIEELLKDYPDINMDKFNSALIGVTCMFCKEEGVIIYHCDVELAIKCGTQNRNPTALEWD